MFLKTKFVGVALATLVVASLTACGGGEEKETRTPSDKYKAEAIKGGVDLAVPKSYVREKKTDTPPPFIVLAGDNNVGSSFALDNNGDEILTIKATSKKGDDCAAEYVLIFGGGVGELKCGPNEVAVIEVTTKSSGKVTYKF